MHQTIQPVWDTGFSVPIIISIQFITEMSAILSDSQIMHKRKLYTSFDTITIVINHEVKILIGQVYERVVEL
jgi:hypothetical protein